MIKKNNSKLKVAVLTLGCAKNVVDSEELLTQIDHSDFETTDNIDEAKILVINTCGFIEDAKKESIDTIMQSIELKKEGKFQKVIVMGCLAERYKLELQEEIPEVDAYVGVNKLKEVTKKLGIDFKSELLGERHLTTPKHFAYLKISEGCTNPCSFCAIPIIRGEYNSKPIERIVKEAQKLATLGVSELILIAQDTTYYGIDIYGKRALKPLLEKLCNIDGIRWIRLMYTYPAQFPLEILDLFVDNNKLCKYIDIPIQHISDNVLKSMQRGISARETRKLLEKIRNKIPEITLRTSLIVGYPTEGEKEFKELSDFVRETEFERLGVFTYSIEENTKAFSLGDLISQEVKNARRDQIMEIQQGISYKKNKSMINKEIDVVVDRKENGVAYCRSEQDAPEIDNEIIIESASKLKTGNFYKVKIVDNLEYDLIAKMIRKI